MSNINTLSENYGDVINRHTEIINNKANTFEESYIYQNDILNVKEQKFDNISVCFQALRNKVNYIKNSINRETEFNNIAVSLDNLISKFDMCIDTLQENSKKINLASKAAYEEYCQEFTTLENKYDLNKRVFNSKSDLFSTNSETITTKEGEIDKLRRRIDSYQGGGDPSVLSNLKSKIHYLEIDISDLKGQNESHLLFMEYHLSKMKEASDELKRILEIALKKGTAAQ